jgi:uncharacterized protein (TIGR03435 family)
VSTRSILLLTAIVAVAAVGLHSQAAPERKSLAFEVASIKPLGPFTPIPALGPGCDGGFPRVEHNRFTVTTTAFALITWAYGFNKNGGCSFVSVGDFLTGGPDWIRSEKFEIRALMPEGSPDYTTSQFLNGAAPALERMISQMLADRFKLVMHTGTKDAPVYALVVAKNGPKLVASSGDITPRGRGPAPQPNVRVLRARTSMTYLALSLVIEARRPVIDRTGLAGDFDFELTFAPFNASATDSTAPDLFTAVQEQLGLRLESTRAPVDVLVIDHVEKPMPD